MSSLDISLESPGTPGALLYVGGEGGASSKPEGRPEARRAALRKRKAPLEARTPPERCGEVAPAQAGSLCSDAEGNQLTSPSQPHVRTLPTCCRLDPRLWNRKNC